MAGTPIASSAGISPPSGSKDSSTRSGSNAAMASTLGLKPDRSVTGAPAGWFERLSTATTWSPAPMAKSTSVEVGEIDTIRWGFAGITTSPFSAAIVTGKGAGAIVVDVVVEVEVVVAAVDDVVASVDGLVSEVSPLAEAHEATSRPTAATRRAIRRVMEISSHWRRWIPAAGARLLRRAHAHRQGGDLATSSRITVAGQRRNRTGLRSMPTPGSVRGSDRIVAVVPGLPPADVDRIAPAGIV